jgi:hypothetical protein
MIELVIPVLATGVIVLSALALVVPAPMVAVRQWLRRSDIEVGDATAVAAQVGLLKACLFSVLALCVAGLLGVALEAVLPIGSGWAYGPALALLITAAVATSAVSFPGSSTRRASLAPRSVGDLASRRTLMVAGVLSVGVPALAVTFGSAYRSQTRPVMVYPLLTAGPLLPAQDLSLFAQVVAVSVVLTAIGTLAMRYTMHRPSFSQAGGEVDLALRRLFSQRITAGVVGGQLILLAVTLPGLQMLTLHDVGHHGGQTFYTVSDTWLLVGVIGGLIAFAGGIAVWAYRSGIFLLWSPSLNKPAPTTLLGTSRADSAPAA